MHFRPWTLGAALAAFCAASSVQGANLVTNGGFEAGTFSGWTLTGDQSLSAVACAPAFASEGSCAAFFGPLGDTGGVSQALNGLTAGGLYTISFAVEASGDDPSSVSASFGGAALLNLSNPTATAPAFKIYNFDVLASATTQTLSFNFRDDAGFEILDAVSVAAVPEPSGWALLGTGLAVVAFARQRRWRRWRQLAT